MTKTQDPYVLKDGFLLYGSRLCVTKNLRAKVMLESHAPLNEGHRGIQATMNAKKMYLHWPSMKHAIEGHVSQCMMCQKLKYDRGKLRGCYNLCWCLRIHGKVFQWTLLKSIQGNNGIWIIVACLRKQTYSLPVRKTSKA